MSFNDLKVFQGLYYALLVLCIVAALLILFPLFKGKVREMKKGSGLDDLEKSKLPRVHLNDSSWFERLIDPIASFSCGSQLLSKGYKMVKSLLSN